MSNYLLVSGLIFKMVGILALGLIYGLITAFLFTSVLDSTRPWYARVALSVTLLMWLAVGLSLIFKPGSM